MGFLRPLLSKTNIIRVTHDVCKNSELVAVLKRLRTTGLDHYLKTMQFSVTILSPTNKANAAAK